MAGCFALGLDRISKKLSALRVVYGGFRHRRVLKSNSLQESLGVSVPGWLAAALCHAELPVYSAARNACWVALPTAGTFSYFSFCDGSQLCTYRDHDLCSRLPSSAVHALTFIAHPVQGDVSLSSILEFGKTNRDVCRT